MINRKPITTEQAKNAIAYGEFENEMLNSKPKVIIVLTQDWCPQWHDMKGWIYQVNTDEDVDIYELEYNKTDYFDDFRSFKENEMGNNSVPYLRFYKNGALYRDSNYISQGQFREIIGR